MCPGHQDCSTCSLSDALESAKKHAEIAAREGNSVVQIKKTEMAKVVRNKEIEKMIFKMEARRFLKKVAEGIEEEFERREEVYLETQEKLAEGALECRDGEGVLRRFREKPGEEEVGMAEEAFEGLVRSKGMMVSVKERYEMKIRDGGMVDADEMDRRVIRMKIQSQEFVNIRCKFELQKKVDEGICKLIFKPICNDSRDVMIDFKFDEEIEQYFCFVSLMKDNRFKLEKNAVNLVVSGETQNIGKLVMIQQVSDFHDILEFKIELIKKSNKLQSYITKLRKRFTEIYSNS